MPLGNYLIFNHQHRQNIFILNIIIIIMIIIPKTGSNMVNIYSLSSHGKNQNYHEVIIV